MDGVAVPEPPETLICAHSIYGMLIIVSREKELLLENYVELSSWVCSSCETSVSDFLEM